MLNDVAPLSMSDARASVAVAAGRASMNRASAVLPVGAVSEVSAPSLPSRDRARYEPVRKLGEGSFGEVSLVRDNDIARLVALKRLKAEWHQGETLGRFVDEIQAVGQLEHPGIVPIHDVGLDEHGYFFVMKYVEGQSLDQIIEKLKAGDPETEARFSYEARADLFLQVLQAVRFAHERGIIHRDLKPENIMVGPYGEVMVMDWGLSKRVVIVPSANPAEAAPDAATAAVIADQAIKSSLGGERQTSTRVGSIIGSPAYMSPEQARGRTDLVDVRSDLYSLAAVFYELLTLDHYLPPKPTAQMLLVAVMVEQPLAATAIHHRYGVPPEFTFYLRKGLEKDPTKRFQSASEMASALRAILDGDIPVQCPCTGLKAAGNRWFDFIDAHPVGAISAAVLTSACALYGVYGLVRQAVALVSG
jgi:eukaryotic-like serine/threonine-protein kinase